MIPEGLRDLSVVNPANDSEHYYCVDATEFEIDRGIIRGVIWGPRKDAGGKIMTCDDGNVDSGDGCSAACVDEFCGDGIDNDGSLEQCDGANYNNNDHSKNK